MPGSSFGLPEFCLEIVATDLVRKCWEALESWRSFVFAVDGRDTAGKTALARYLAYRMNMPHIQGDLFLIPGMGVLHYDYLGEVISRRLAKGERSPLIFDSIFALDVLKRFGIKPDLTIRVAQVGNFGSDSWRSEFKDYEHRHHPDFWFIRKCENAPASCLQVDSGCFVACDGCPDVRHLESHQALPWVP